jgi:hypothetical protein
MKLSKRIRIRGRGGISAGDLFARLTRAVNFPVLQRISIAISSAIDTFFVFGVGSFILAARAVLRGTWSPPGQKYARW